MVREGWWASKNIASFYEESLPISMTVEVVRAKE